MLRLVEERKFVLRTEFVLTNLLAFLATLKAAVLSGELIEVIVRPFVEKRSSAANARMWLLHTAAGRHVGCTSDDMHEDTLCEFYGYNEVRMPSGYVKRVPVKRTSGMNKREFGEHMQRLEAFYISELGVWLDHQLAA